MRTTTEGKEVVMGEEEEGGREEEEGGYGYDMKRGRVTEGRRIAIVRR